MNKNLSLAIEKAVEQINPKDNFPINKSKSDKKPDLFSLTTNTELFKNDKVSKISIVGAGMVSTPGVTYKMFRALAKDNINILAISTSEIKISVIINDQDTLKAVKKLHTIFELD